MSLLSQNQGQGGVTERGSNTPRTDYRATTQAKGRRHTVTDDHSSFQRFVSKGLVADAAGPLVDVEKAAHAVAGAMQVVQARVPQGSAGERVQQVT